jgi:thiamine-phosphate pyrophosphorylase
MPRSEAKTPAMATSDCRLYLFTPPLTPPALADFAPRLSEALGTGDVASVLLRFAPEAQGDAKRIAERLLAAAAPYEAAILLEGDPRLAARVGADGVHVAGAGEAFAEALASLQPERIVGAGGLRSRDDAMAAGEAGADYVMFGEPRRDGFVPPLAETVERVAWWAEIFQTPCVGYAAQLDDVSALAAAGADFVALGEAVWGASSVAKAIVAATAAAAIAVAARADTGA